MSIVGGKTKVLKMNLSNAVALDFDWLAKKIYWSDVTDSASKIMRMNADGTGEEVILLFTC